MACAFTWLARFWKRLASYARRQGFEADAGVSLEAHFSAKRSVDGYAGATGLQSVVVSARTASKFARVAVSDGPRAASMLLRLSLSNGRRAELELANISKLGEVLNLIERAV